MSEPKVTFPEGLPISAHVRELALAIDAHPVVVVEGETGSGKTTQLPKICLAMGRGLDKQIGVTEPRRIAATSVAARVASELGVELGREVGCQIRFSNQTSRETYVKFMTDGILLAEIPRDPQLRAYDTIILDEAHERSLNIDFLMGHLKRVLAERKDLRVIVSSATMATDRISAFFGGAPIVRVSGRTFPVETVYAPIDPSEPDMADAIARVIDDVTELDPRGDVLVFLPGEREIKETANALAHRAMPRTTVLPLFGRLARADQQRVFESTPERKVILATNVAETSLTIPGVTSVIDTGLARVNRYQARTGVTQLLVEPISRASAEQRKGRAGRTQGGVCFRLYDEKEFALRGENTDPEILRVGLSGAILQFITLGLGDLRTFPLLDPPPKRAILEGYRVLEELGAITEDETLTPIGRTLARLPLDPRLGRMILAGDDEGVLEEVLIIAAALALQDPRERPQGLEAKAEQAHRRYRVEGSDFLSLLELFRFYEREATSTRLARKVCRDSFLSWTRMREWLDTRDQLARQYKEARERGREPAPSGARRGKKGEGVGDRVHRAVLTGLASRIGMWHAESRTYVGARQTRFVLHPSSVLAKKPPQWVVVAELVETSRLFGRVVAAIDPTWLEETAAHLVRRSYGESHFAEKRGEPMVKEQATLYGLPIVRERSVPLGPIDAAAARACFVLEGLVRGGYAPKVEAPYLKNNAALIDRWKHLRSRARRQGLDVDLEERTKRFLESRIPDGVYDATTFEAWRKDAERDKPQVLFMSLGDLGDDGADEVSASDYPDELVVDGMRLPVRYAFDPSEDCDGATLEVPIALLADLDAEQLEWTIPGWHARKIAELLHGLPKATQRAFGFDSTDVLAARLAAKLVPFEGPMRPALARVLYEETGVRVGPTRFVFEDLPGYLRFHYRVVEGGKTLAESSDLRDLQTRFQERSRAAFLADGAGALAEQKLTRFPEGGLARPRRLASGVDAYPAIVLHDGALELAWTASTRRADAMTRRALPTLYAFALQTSLGALEKKLSGRIEPVDRRDVVRRALDETFAVESGPLPRTASAFQERIAGGDKRLSATLAELGRLALDVSDELEPTRRLAKAMVGQPGAPRSALDDVASQLEHLVPPGWFLRMSRARLASLPMYLRGIRVRLERLPNGPQKDRAKADTVVPFWTDWLAKRGELLASGVPPEEVDAFHWLVEEFRVAVFAPEAGRPLSLSAKRLSEAWAELLR